MSAPPKISINLDEKFPLLDSAPSVEAVIYWQAQVSKNLERGVLEKELNRQLPDYPICQPQDDIEIGATGSPDGTELSYRSRWNGFRLEDAQGRHVAQFMPTGVVFSRLEPYEKWEDFKAEALRFWNIFVELAEPTTMQRLGVRHLNRISLADGEQPSLYLKIAPIVLPGLKLSAESFFYQDTYRVPNYPYAINWVKTIQPKGEDPANESSLIFDIDVFTTEPLLLKDAGMLTQRLGEMRWLKNKVFFSSITDTAQERFGVRSHDH